jgi:hypothetical protein
MGLRVRTLALPAAAATACLAFAGSAAAGTASFSGTVANGGCDAARAVPVSAPTRIEVALASTAQDNTNVLAEIVAPSGQVVGGGSRVAYDTPGAGNYSIRVCAVYQAQSPPSLQYSGLLGTGPAGQAVLSGPEQPQPAVGGVLGVQTFVGHRVSGHAAILTRSGLAWFTVRTASNGKATLRIFDPMHRVTRLVKGMTTTVSDKTIRVTGHGLKLVVQTRGKDRISFTSSRFKATGRVVRGGIQIIA